MLKLHLPNGGELLRYTLNYKLEFPYYASIYIFGFVPALNIGNKPLKCTHL